MINKYPIIKRYVKEKDSYELLLKRIKEEEMINGNTN